MMKISSMFPGRSPDNKKITPLNRRNFVKTIAAATAATSVSAFMAFEKIPVIESDNKESLNASKHNLETF